MNWLLSGGIGSGKSEVRRLLERHGLITIDADRIGHEVLSPGGPAAPGVAERWPEVVVDGSIDRSLLAGVVFSDPAALTALETLTHPHIFNEILTRVKSADGPVIVEIPQLIQPFGDRWPRIVADAPDETRRLRAIRRGLSPADAEHRMAAQPSRSQYLAAADIVVPNHGTLEELEHAVELLAEEIRGRERPRPG